MIADAVAQIGAAAARTEAREVYAANMTLRGADEFRRILREDFAELRRSGCDHPGMARIEKLFLSGKP